MRKEDEPVYEIAGLFGFMGRFKLTDQSFGSLRAAKVSEEVLRKLEPLKDQDCDREQFRKEVTRCLTNCLVNPELTEFQNRLLKLSGFTIGSGGWTVAVYPRPSEAESPSSLREAWGKELTEVGVVHGSTLLFRGVGGISMTEDQVAQAVLADLRMTGFKRPKLLVLKDNRYFSVVLTGLNMINNSTQIAAIDVNTHEQIHVPMNCVVEFKEIS